MKKIETIVSLALIVFMAVFFFSCDIIDSFLGEEESDTFVIGICSFQLGEPWDSLFSGMTQNDESDDSVDLKFVNIYTSFGDYAGIKAGFVQNDLFSDYSVPSNCYYTGFNNFNGGKAQMEFVADKLNGSGNICILNWQLPV